MEWSVVGHDETKAQAEEAVYTLDQAVVPVTQVSMVTQNLASDTVPHGHITPGDDLPPHGAATRAWVGGLVGVLLGAAVLWVTGLGPLLVVG